MVLCATQAMNISKCSKQHFEMLVQMKHSVMDFSVKTFVYLKVDFYYFD